MSMSMPTSMSMSMSMSMSVSMSMHMHVQVAAFRRGPSPPLDGKLDSAGYHPFTPLDATEEGESDRPPMAAKRPGAAAMAALLEAPLECM